jgi:hypothetical protein
VAEFSFDLINAAGYGYHRVWVERIYLARLALIPFLLKFALTVTIYALGYEDQFLRRGLIMLPAVFAEGWVLAQFLRTLLLEERWPMPIPKPGDVDALAKVILRARGIVSSALVYVLISLVTTILGWMAFTMDQNVQDLVKERGASEAMETDANPVFLIPALALMFFMIWGFRLLWIYLPYSVLMPAQEFLQKIKGFSPSLRMIGLFLICIVPVNVLASLGSYAMLSPFGQSMAEAPDVIRFAILFLIAFTDILTTLVVTAGMAYALRAVLPHHPSALEDINP